MAGPVEEAGQTARGLIDALKAQPAVLALSLAQIAMLVFLFYALLKAAEFRDTMIKGQLDENRRVNELLSKCIVPGPRTELPIDRSAMRVDPPKPKLVDDLEKPNADQSDSNLLGAR